MTDGKGDDLWGMFCNLDTNKAFICDRDGIFRDDASEIGYERINHYGWYTTAPSALFHGYEKCKKKYND